MIRCKWCDEVVDEDWSVGDDAIWTDADGVEHECTMLELIYGPCSDKFGDTSQCN